MYAKGHIGLTLLMLSLLMLPFGANANAFFLIGLASGVSTLPDIDLEWQRSGIPVHHRGVTHSLLFAIMVGTLVGGIFYYGYETPSWFVTGFLGGFLGIISHLIGDSLTSHSFKPLWPFSSIEVGFGLCKASDKSVNENLMILGGLAFILYAGSVSTLL
ncbi:hypothetical protein DRN98_04295 [Methanosarcinales archaeon]|nr:MAG: hypothetical protein DRN98_04295 [Methanosarcinales archaeon]